MTEIRVMKVEVRIERAVELWMLVKNWTKDCDMSKIVCLQVKAIVKPRATIMRILSSERSSLLYWLPAVKNLGDLRKFIIL